MPKGIYKRKIGINCGRGVSNGSKGKHWKLSKETKEKMKGHIAWNKGKKMSKKFCRKINKILRENNPMWRLDVRRKIGRAHKGKKCNFWKGGITPENKKIWRSIEMRLWREAVFARDNWICQKCRIKGGKLHPHHIQNFAQYSELRFAIDNGITLCANCHKKFHKRYNYKSNTKEQLEEFLKRSGNLLPNEEK